MPPDEIRRLKYHEDKNSRLKKNVCDLTLDREMLRGTSFAESSQACPDTGVGRWDVGELGRVDPQGIWALRFDPSSYQCKSRRTGQAALEPRIKEICETRVRFGYRRIHVLLRREGWHVNIKKTQRIYNELVCSSGTSVRRCG